MICRVSSKNKGKQAERKIVSKNKDQTEKKKYKETENSIAGSGTQFICTCRQLLDH